MNEIIILVAKIRNRTYDEHEGGNRTMTKGELGDILEGLLKECQRRRELGGYSVDAPILAYYCDVLIKLTLHLLNQEKDIIKLQRRKLK